MTTDPFTVFGADGFVGRHLCSALAAAGRPVRRVRRDSWPEPGAMLGHLVFTIGMTAGFRGQALETTHRQVVLLHEALSRYRYRSFLYLSSTRVYRGSHRTDEDASLTVTPTDPDDIYNVTKLAGECLCLSIEDPSVRVARLSNIYGSCEQPRAFLGMVLEEAASTGHVTLMSAPGSSKDYLHVDDAAGALVQIALAGRHRLYNVASGVNLDHASLAARLRLLGVSTDFADDAPTQSFPGIDISRLAEEFGFAPRMLDTMLPSIFNHHRQSRERAKELP